VLNNEKPFTAVTRPLAATGAGAFVCAGAQVGPHGGDVLTVPALPRLQWTSLSAGSAVGAMSKGYQPTIRIPFEHMTQNAPVTPGELGSYPAREPEPV
jgi:hypothetical protein